MNPSYLTGSDGSPGIHASAQSEENNPNSVLHYWKTILYIRKGHPVFKDVLIYGDFTLLDADNPDVFVYKRSFEGISIVVVCNFRAKEVEWIKDVGEVGGLLGTQIIGNYPDVESREDKLSLKRVLRPFEAFACVLDDPTRRTIDTW